MHTNIIHIHTTHTSYIHITPHTHTHTQSPWSAILRHSGTLGTLQSPIHRRKDLSCGLSASQTRTGCWSASTLQTSQETQPAGLILSASRAEGRRVQRGADSAKAGRSPMPSAPALTPSHRGRLSTTHPMSGGYPGGLGWWGRLGT